MKSGCHNVVLIEDIVSLRTLCTLLRPLCLQITGLALAADFNIFEGPSRASGTADARETDVLLKSRAQDKSCFFAVFAARLVFVRCCDFAKTLAKMALK
jgi:hypothetical protein